MFVRAADGSKINAVFVGRIYVPCCCVAMVCLLVGGAAVVVGGGA